jgi:UDP-N-acetylmuramate dehydrogenase
MSIPGISEEIHGDEVLVTAGAGVVWNDFVNYCVQKGFAGVENLSLIPGTVGASPIQNIGAYGVELKDVFESCSAYEISTGKHRSFNHEDCRFGYRDSIFKNEMKGQYIITEVRFRLSRSCQYQHAIWRHSGRIGQKRDYTSNDCRCFCCGFSYPGKQAPGSFYNRQCRKLF